MVTKLWTCYFQNMKMNKNKNGTYIDDMKKKK